MKQTGRAGNRQTVEHTMIGFFFLFFCFFTFLCLTRCTTGVETMLPAIGEKTFLSSSKSRLACLVLRVCRFGVLPSTVATLKTFFF